MKIRCKSCKKSFVPPDRGRRPQYCNAACRQKAYRKRATAPHRKIKLLQDSDLYKIQDISARNRAAVKVLEEAGFQVTLERRAASRPRRKPRLTIVNDEETTR